MTITREEALSAWGALEQEQKKKKYRFYTPLSEAATWTVEEAQDMERVYTGIPQFDAQMRGIGRSHLLNIVGYSHSGKTLVLLSILEANKDKRIAYFCPDETASLVLVKLTSIVTGVSARELEERVSQGDKEAIDLLYATAKVHFPNLAVFEDSLSPHFMEAAYSELCEEVWGGKDAQMVIVDYVDLLEDAGDTAATKFNWLKAFGKTKRVPLILIHQTSRTAGSDGRAMKIDSGNFGGEQHATFMIGVRRKKNAILAELADARSKASPPLDRIQELEHDLLLHEFTITLNLVKNKRPGGSTVDEIDFELDTATGKLLPMGPDGIPEQWSRIHSRAARPTDVVQSAPTWEEDELDYGNGY